MISTGEICWFVYSGSLAVLQQSNLVAKEEELAKEINFDLRIISFILGRFFVTCRTSLRGADVFIAGFSDFGLWNMWIGNSERVTYQMFAGRNGEREGIEGREREEQTQLPPSSSFIHSFIHWAFRILGSATKVLCDLWYEWIESTIIPLLRKACCGFYCPLKSIAPGRVWTRNLGSILFSVT
jgi:hypothetical protein